MIRNREVLQLKGKVIGHVEWLQIRRANALWIDLHLAPFRRHHSARVLDDDDVEADLAGATRVPDNAASSRDDQTREMKKMVL
jgi:hypothetical protein